MVQLSAENEISGCPASVESGATGVAVVQINADTGGLAILCCWRVPTTPNGLGGPRISVSRWIRGSRRPCLPSL